LDAGLVLQAIACVSVLLAMWQMGNKHISGPALGVVSDVCFFALNIYAHLWLTAAMCAALGVIHTRNFMKWRSEA
jgi:hypothetical protein